MESGRESTRYSQGLLYRNRRGKCVLPEIFEHTGEGERAETSALFYFARRHEKRAVFIFQLALSRSFYSALRDQIEQTFRGNGLERRFQRYFDVVKRDRKKKREGGKRERKKGRKLVRKKGERGGGRYILNQPDRKAENRLADPHRRFP